MFYKTYLFCSKFETFTKSKFLYLLSFTDTKTFDEAKEEAYLFIGK